MREANMEIREVEKEIRGSIDPRLDSPDSPSSLRQAQGSASLRTSPNLPPSAERKNTTQGEPSANKLIDTKNDSDEHV